MQKRILHAYIACKKATVLLLCKLRACERMLLVPSFIYNTGIYNVNTSSDFSLLTDSVFISEPSSQAMDI
jgi:hypothetical protein